MKIISIMGFSTEEGAYKTVELPLDERPGLFFRVATNTFSTPPFTVSNDEVPVQMLHDDRAVDSVKITVADKKVKIYQIYQQVEKGFLITEANEDWTDTAEYRPVFIDALSLDTVQLTNGRTEDVVTSISGQNLQVRLRIGNTGSGTLYSHVLTTVDGKKYMYAITWTAHNAGTSQNPNYDYHYADVPRMIQVYGKD